MEYKYLQNFNAEVDIEPFLPLSQILMILKSHRDLTKGVLIIVQHYCDDEPVTLSYIAIVSQDIATILPILQLLLDDRLGRNVSRYFQSFSTIGREGYQWKHILDKFIPTGVGNFLEDIDSHWIQHTDDFIICNKHYKEEDQGGYTINVGSFDITGTLSRSRIIGDGNKSLQTMGVTKVLSDDNSYMNIKAKDGKHPATNETEVLTSIAKTLPLADKKRLDILSKNEDFSVPESTRGNKFFGEEGQQT